MLIGHDEIDALKLMFISTSDNRSMIYALTATRDGLRAHGLVSTSTVTSQKFE